ncbi:hypothetical protein [Chondromyces apiculatus]|uniref:Haem-binding uptake Tiki superfamily ChaN domain-containing protein n=1 Tax=Chondromyces apiculatus DSM 436 TaxID=1192034 RepID=A0A017SYD2_9BACT|nr:hypothetical protein [Chondromyces apiculatus]EYF01600.1 Hypothetical protein CAP_8040 [Chondromyces apiculatus DSM 436]
MRKPSTLLAMTLLLAACASPQPPAGGASTPVPVAAAPEASASQASGAVATAGAAPSAAPTSAAAVAPAATPGPASCGALGCLLFDTPVQAFSRVLESSPRVLAVGESHAQQGNEGVASATKRFTESFLPLLSGKASDLIVELWAVDPSCNKQKVAKVQEEQKAVTQSQAQGNQSEFVTLGHEAKRLGVVPDILRPSCAEYDAILKAGQGSIDQMLEMIARLTAAKAKALLARESMAGKMVVAYGGALHNDLAPGPGRERWSFGPELQAHTGGKYVELDIIVREFIKDTDSWKALPWYAHFKRDENPDKAILFNPAPGSYVLIFPRSS